jgi:hypothetical protein
MEIIKNKLLAIKNNIHSKENKCNNKQIKQTGNEWRLSSEKTNISNDSVEMEMFSKNRHVPVKTKQTSKNLCINNSEKKPRQHRQCIEIGLVKNKNPILLHPPVPLILKVLQKFREKRKIIILIVPSWKVQVWSSLLKSLTISTILLGKSENVLMKGKDIKKRDLQLQPGSLNAHLLRNAFYGYKAKAFEFSTYMKKERENIADRVTYQH